MATQVDRREWAIRPLIQSGKLYKRKDGGTTRPIIAYDATSSNYRDGFYWNDGHQRWGKDGRLPEHGGRGFLYPSLQTHSSDLLYEVDTSGNFVKGQKFVGKKPHAIQAGKLYMTRQCTLVRTLEPINDTRCAEYIAGYRYRDKERGLAYSPDGREPKRFYEENDYDILFEVDRNADRIYQPGERKPGDKSSGVRITKAQFAKAWDEWVHKRNSAHMMEASESTSFANMAKELGL